MKRINTNHELHLCVGREKEMSNPSLTCECNVDQSLIKVNTASQNTTSGTRSKLTEKGTYLTVLAVF